MGQGLFVITFASSSLFSGFGGLVTTYVAYKLSALVYEKLDLARLGSKSTVQSQSRNNRANSASSKREISRSGSRPRSRSHSIEDFKSKASLTMVASALLCWLFTSYLFLRSILSGILFIQTLQSKMGSRKKFEEIQKKNYYKSLISISLFLLCMCYGLMSSICFERLCSVFATSQYKLSTLTIRTFRWTIGSASIAAITGFVFYFWVPSLPYAILILPGVFVYPFTLLYSTFRFYRITQQISGSMIPSIQDKDSNSVSMSTNQSVMLSHKSLMNGSLRLTIVTFCVILSSVLMLAVTFLHGATQDPMVLLLLHIMSATDLICNAYCLLCTYSVFEKEYLFVFGMLHRYWMNRLAPI